MQYIFVGTGKQAKNILLCLLKNKRIFNKTKNKIIGVDPSFQQLKKFYNFAKKIFPQLEIYLYKINEKLKINPKNTVAFITSPPKYHKENFIYLISIGVKKIILEKPIAACIKDFNDILKIAKQKKINLYIQEQYFYSIATKELQRLVRNPSLFIKEKTKINEKKQLIVERTKSFFLKKRLKSLLRGRWVENICLIELPHILSLLNFIFGKLKIKEFKNKDLIFNNKLYVGYKEAKIVLSDKNGIPHEIYLSNVRRITRKIVINLNNDIKVIFDFPGKLKKLNHRFFSKITIYKKNKILYYKKYEDDHLKKAVKSYILWKNILGSLKKCARPNKMILELVGCNKIIS